MCINWFSTYDYGQIINNCKSYAVNIINYICLEVSWIQNNATNIVRNIYFLTRSISKMTSLFLSFPPTNVWSYKQHRGSAILVGGVLTCPPMTGVLTCLQTWLSHGHTVNTFSAKWRLDFKGQSFTDICGLNLRALTYTPFNCKYCCGWKTVLCKHQSDRTRGFLVMQE